MEPVSNVGRFGRMLMLCVGIVLLVIGSYFTIREAVPDNSRQTTATIIGFAEQTENDSGLARTYTLVSYNIGNNHYDNVALGQYEKSWKTGDRITIIYDPDSPEDIQTKAMTYGGFILILLGIPFVFLSIFYTVTIRRRAAKTPEEIAEDEERTTAGKLKYKISSIVIPLSVGIPIFSIGTICQFLENNSELGMLCMLLGGITIIVGIRALVIYFIIKYRHYKEDKAEKKSA